MTKSSMLVWYSGFGSSLPAGDKDLLTLTAADLETLEHAYDGLAGKVACKRVVNGQERIVTFGPTGAAKTLFAVRPHGLIPWDDPIREHFELDGSGHSYCDFLRKAQGWLLELSRECQRHGFQLFDLPKKLNEPESTVVKLIDEYLWVTISQNCPAPEKSEFERWGEWS